MQPVTPFPAPSPSRRHLLPPLVALLLVAAAWLSTLQVTIGAANDPHLHPSGLVDPLMDDSGEFVVAWHTWGVVHPPGYPLLALGANPVAQSLHRLGLPGVAAAGLVSLLCALAALAVLAWIVGRGGGDGWGPAAAVLLAGFGLMTWLYASVAEAYALGLLLGFGMVAVALHVGDAPSRRGALALGLVIGLAAGHHRTLLALAPAVAVAAWPARRLGTRAWLGAALVALASLAVYLYLPLAALAGSPWVYGRSPATWAGFWDAVLAREYGAQLGPPTAPAEIVAALAGRLAFAAEENLAALVLGGAGLVLALATPRTRRVAAVLGLTAAGYLLAPVGQYLVIGTHMLVMAATVALAGAAGLGVTALGERRVGLGRVAAVIAVLAGLTLAAAHRGRVLEYTRDPLGARLIAAAARSMPRVTLVEAWGPRYFALAYGRLVSGEIAHHRLVDARADLSGLTDSVKDSSWLVTTQDLLYLVPLARWAERLGRPVYPSAEAEQLVTLRSRPWLLPRPSTGSAEVSVDGAKAWREGQDLRLSLIWQARVRPSRDYHVFVKVYGPPAADGTRPLLAQGDRQHPVYGFYPTTDWQAGQRVWDQFRVALPPGAKADEVSVGLYTVNPDGSFTDHMNQVIPIGPPPPNPPVD